MGTIVWATQTSSPSPSPADAHARDPIEQKALAKCGPAEVGLDRVARSMATRKAAGSSLPSPDVIDTLQRAAGEPHPWARAWATQFSAPSTDTALAKLEDWVDGERTEGVRRCGAARAAAPDGTSVLVVLAIDALADLDPLPVRARTGQWLTVQAHVSARARSGRVVVLGPSGEPHDVPSTFEKGGLVRARFAVDRPGEITIQVLADMPSGPRPVLEATVFGDVAPPAHPGERTAPGEGADAGWADGRDDDRIARMLLAARADSGVAPFARDPRLDAIAHAHAVKMAARQQLAHDVGDGTPMDRLHAQSLDPREAGENVAMAATAPLAHRALWESPSHRANMLKRDFDHFGIGVEKDAQGNLWVAELFVRMGK
jgi:hypothetical protein